MREGFWGIPDKGRFQLLPLPLPLERHWKGRREFLFALEAAQRMAQATNYKGYSHCRLCDESRNGSAEYLLKGWVWPSGYGHYVDAHNVRPSLAFQEFILGYEIS